MTDRADSGRLRNVTMTDTPDGTIPYAIDAILFNPDNSVTIQYADPEKVSRNPKVRSGSLITVDYDLNGHTIEVITEILARGCDLIAFAQEAERAPAARIPGRI